MRGVMLLLVGATLASACVDGKTPDCSTVDSGCYPSDAPLVFDVGGGDGALDANADAQASDAEAGAAVDASVD